MTTSHNPLVEVFLQQNDMEDEALETSSLVWVNSLLRALWPNATVALENYINQELTTKLQRDLPSPFNSILEEKTWLITGDMNWLSKAEP
eukprot:symbB.v1.2.029323.t1/scaffold3085.1/size64040/6